MDARALLSAQGWRGAGHSLHKSDDSIGLAKPLLLNRKDNTRGLGQKQHFTSDQWWMNAFDEQLKGLDTSKEGSVVQTVTTGKLNAIDKPFGKWSVYATFVRGGFLEGTIEKVIENDTSTSTDADDTQEEVVETSKTTKPIETKEERRARKEAKRKRKEERAVAKAARKEKKKNKSKSKKSSAESSDADEEKRRRRAKKEEKRRQRQKEATK